MSVWSEAWDAIKAAVMAPANAVATGSAAAGAAAGTSPLPAPGPKMVHSTAPNETPGQAALRQLQAGPAVAPGEAIKQSAQGIVGAGPWAGSFRTPVVWAIIIVIALIGIWGLIAPGGGVALIERRMAGR